MVIEPGTKVVAIRDITDGVVTLYGYGTYVGNELPPIYEAEVGAMIEVLAEEQELGAEDSETLEGVANSILGNPKIVLDDGGVVWGYQCWWSSIESFEEQGFTNIVTMSREEREKELGE